MDAELFEQVKQEVITSRLLQTVLQRLVAEEDEPLPPPKQRALPKGLHPASS